MVYMDPGELGWRPCVKSWMQREAVKLKDETKVNKRCVTSGYENLTSARELLTSGHERLTSGVENFTNGREILTSGYERLTSGVENLTSGREILTSRYKRLTRGHERLTSGPFFLFNNLKTRPIVFCVNLTR